MFLNRESFLQNVTVYDLSFIFRNCLCVQKFNFRSNTLKGRHGKQQGGFKLKKTSVFLEVITVRYLSAYHKSIWQFLVFSIKHCSVTMFFKKVDYKSGWGIGGWGVSCWLRSKVPWAGWHSLALRKAGVEVKGSKISLCCSCVPLEKGGHLKSWRIHSSDADGQKL